MNEAIKNIDLYSKKSLIIGGITVVGIILIGLSVYFYSNKNSVDNKITEEQAKKTELIRNQEEELAKLRALAATQPAMSLKEQEKALNALREQTAKTKVSQKSLEQQERDLQALRAAMAK